MQINKTRCHTFLNAFDFKNLFIEELGWDHYQGSFDVQVDGVIYTLHRIAEKRGFVALRCASPGGVPPYPIRRKIDAQVAKSHHEHLIIFTDPDESMQVWQWVRREIGKPTACRERKFYKNQTGEALLQKLEWLAFSLDEEDDLTIVDVASRVRVGLDVERITRRFYDAFKKERDAFERFLEGIPDDNLQRWYVSVMLNRLMFIYFIQKKGFLDGDQDYLRKRLENSRSAGTDRYYRDFLCPLFFEGFACKETERSEQTNCLLGWVPYLNGGLFLKHQVEELHGEAIQIPDAAFERLFGFFDRYQWHLDERPLRQDNEINPDVLGYIFEKYINQKQMGAYYTKEDITEYISKNTILPYLLDQARRALPSAFDRHAWPLLQADPGRYIYPAVRKGVELPLPPDIEAGVGDVSQRGGWNKAAPEEYALPTEIWREVVARRQRYREVRAKIEKGEIHEVNDLITYNLDIRQFTQDLIESLSAPELLRPIWKALNDIKILDPTVGSGAFLFAALNILEPLYEACLERMGVFLDELDASREPHHPERLKDFRQARAQAEQHPNQRYFILKTIIVNNLYGVDIMDEAVEICKLRLFLKLVAQVDDAALIEPLPDIDFNVRAGNTLVGFVTLEEVQRAITMGKTKDGVTQDRLFALDEDQKTLLRVQQQAEDIERLFARFREQQTMLGGEVTPQDKAQLKGMLNALGDELNRYLAREYAIHNPGTEAYQKWLSTHKPFHWFIEFYGIVSTGGFDIVIGNPPYVEYSEVKNEYQPLGSSLLRTGNLFSICVERFANLCKRESSVGVIVPISSISTLRMRPFMEFVIEQFPTLYTSNFAVRPDKLFVGVDMNLTIIIGIKNTRVKTKSDIYSTRYNRWYSDFRPFLFDTLIYSHSRYRKTEDSSSLLKVGHPLEDSIIRNADRYISIKQLQAPRSTASDTIYYHSGGRYFRKAIRQKLSNEYKELTLQKGWGDVLICLLSSSLYYLVWIVTSDTYHVTKGDIFSMTVPLALHNETNLLQLADKLLQHLWEQSEKRIRIRAGSIQQEVNFRVGQSKYIVDEIDGLLTKYYGFTAEELDFIVNYDIKYRMGGELDDDQ